MTDASRIRATLGLLAGLIRRSPLAAVGLISLTAIVGLRAGVYVYTVGRMTDGLLDGDNGQVASWAAVFIGVMAFEMVGWVVEEYLTLSISDSASRDLQSRALETAGSISLIEYESDEFHGKLGRAIDAMGTHLADVFHLTRDLFQIVVAVGSIIAVLAAIDWRLVPLLIAGTVPGYMLQRRVATLVHEARQRHATDDVEAELLMKLVTERAPAAEIRVFGSGQRLIGDWLDRRQRRGAATVTALRTQQFAGVWSETVQSAAILLALGLVLWQIQRGTVNPVQWAVVTSAVFWVSGFMFQSLAMSVTLREKSSFIDDLLQFERYQQPLPRPSALEPPARIDITITGASFGYADDRPVLRNVSVTIPDGQRVAIVGENGAGKSTLVRLILGLYRPTTGSVTIGGIDTRSPEFASVQPVLSAAFQDFATWPFTLRDNVGLGDLGRLYNDDRIQQAIARAGATDVLDSLEDGLESWLGRAFGDRDLSGGQWQRLAIARALMRDAKLIVLDEPTASLDPLAEQRIFESIGQLTSGRTAITVSHRLGPARLADRILVLHDGEIVEDGAHDELMARDGGRYRTMFLSQAAWYREEIPT